MESWGVIRHMQVLPRVSRALPQPPRLPQTIHTLICITHPFCETRGSIENYPYISLRRGCAERIIGCLSSANFFVKPGNSDVSSPYSFLLSFVLQGEVELRNFG